MPAFVALLRGVNVGGNILKMDRLREVCAAAGMRNVRTYVQSGNVVFDGRGTAAHWQQALERGLEGEARLPVTVIVRTAEEVKRVLAANPFAKEKGIDVARLAVTFLQRAPESAAMERLVAIPAGPDRSRCIGSEIFLHCPGGFGETKLSNNAIEKALGMRATTRNWNTVNRLHEMCET